MAGEGLPLELQNASVAQRMLGSHLSAADMGHGMEEHGQLAGPEVVVRTHYRWADDAGGQGQEEHYYARLAMEEGDSLAERPVVPSLRPSQAEEVVHMAASELQVEDKAVVVP